MQMNQKIATKFFELKNGSLNFKYIFAHYCYLQFPILHEKIKLQNKCATLERIIAQHLFLIIKAQI